MRYGRKCNAFHGKLGKIEEGSDSLSLAVLDDVEDMDRALGKVTYIDMEGNERILVRLVLVICCLLFLSVIPYGLSVCCCCYSSRWSSLFSFS